MTAECGYRKVPEWNNRRNCIVFSTQVSVVLWKKMNMATTRPTHMGMSLSKYVSLVVPSCISPAFKFTTIGT